MKLSSLFFLLSLACAPMAQASYFDDFDVAANKILAGPTSGGNGTGKYRLLVGADLPSPSSSTLGGVQSIASVSHFFLTQISTSGVPSSAQPAFPDISGSATNAQLPNSGPGATSCTNCNLTFDAKGIPTAIASGGGGGGTVVNTVVTSASTYTPTTGSTSGLIVKTQGVQTLADCTTTGPWTVHVSNFGVAVNLAPSGTNTFSDGQASGVTTYQLTDPGANVWVECATTGVLYVTQ